MSGFKQAQLPPSEPGEEVSEQGLHFLNPSLEAAFVSWQFASMRRLFIFTLLVITVISGVNLVVDFSFSQGGATSPFVLGLRLAVTGSALATLLALSIRPDQGLTRSLTELFLVIEIFLTLGMAHSNADYHFIGPVTLVGILFVIYLLCPFSWFKQLGYACAYSLLGLWVWFHQLGWVADFFRLLLWVGFANCLGSFVARQRHKRDRQLFASERRLTSQLEWEQQRQRQQSALVDLLTHELRNPIASIQAHANLINRLQDLTAIHGLAGKILHSSERSAALIEEWVSGDRIAGTGQESVNKLLGEALLEIQGQYPELKVQVFETHLPAVIAEGRLLALVFKNILENAARYAMSERGVEIRYRVWPRRIVVRIRDFGPGLSIEDQKLIFEKHVRCKTGEGKSGVGIGLYLMREMLKRCGAYLRVQSCLGKGSAFLIELPRLD